MHFWVIEMSQFDGWRPAWAHGRPDCALFSTLGDAVRATCACLRSVSRRDRCPGARLSQQAQLRGYRCGVQAGVPDAKRPLHSAGECARLRFSSSPTPHAFLHFCPPPRLPLPCCRCHCVLESQPIHLSPSTVVAAAGLLLSCRRRRRCRHAIAHRTHHSLLRPCCARSSSK